MTRTVALMYHDVVDPAGAPSGFDTPGADGYKLSAAAFDEHLDALAGAGLAAGGDANAPLTLTFDDGGVSAHTTIADRLEARGWRGAFFVTTSRIDTPGFLAADQIADLDRRGHTIGSHSHSHPLQMSRLDPAALEGEWQTSTERLADIVSHPIEVASIPGGGYSIAVARAAHRAGIRDLYTSEPRRGSWAAAGCRLHGRYAIKRATSPAWAAAVARGERVPRWRQRLTWEAKKLAKRGLGDWYLRLRARLVDGRH